MTVGLQAGNRGWAALRVSAWKAWNAQEPCVGGILDATPAASEQSAQRLVDALGKSIGGVVALDVAEGEKVIYLGKSSDELRVTPSSAREPSHDL